MRITAGHNFLSKAREKLLPFYATMELTYRCNLSCIHCYLRDDRSEEMPAGEIMTVIDQLVQQGAFHLIFTGGEPLLRHDFFDIAAYARKKNLALSLMSNGTLIGEEEAGIIRELSFQDVSISIYGFEVHDLVTGVPGSLVQSMEAVRLLRQRNVAVQVKTPVMTLNVQEIEKLGKWCDEVGAGFLPNPDITVRTNGSRLPLDFRLRAEQLPGYLAVRRRQGEQVPGWHDVCNAGRSIVAISPAGDVFPCVALRQKVGNVRVESFAQIWNHAPYLHWLRGLTLKDFYECASCDVRASCVLCPGETLAEEGDFLAPHRASCQIARLRAGIIKKERFDFE